MGHVHALFDFVQFSLQRVSSSSSITSLRIASLIARTLSALISLVKFKRAVVTAGTAE